MKNVGAEGQGFAGGISSSAGGWGREEGPQGGSKLQRRFWNTCSPSLLPCGQPCGQPAGGGVRSPTLCCPAAGPDWGGRAEDCATRQRLPGRLFLSSQAAAGEEGAPIRPSTSSSREQPARRTLSGSLSPPAPWQPEHRPSWRNSLPRTLWLSCFPPPAFRSHQRGEAPGRDSRSWFLCVNTIARESSLFTRLFSLLYPHYAAPKRSRQVSASC